MNDFSMLALFQTEVEQQGRALRDALQALASGEDRSAALGVAGRAAHSIKGAARLVDVSPVVDLAHGMEACLVAAQDGGWVPDSEALNLLQQAMEAIAQLAQAGETYETWLQTHREHYDGLCRDLAQMTQGGGETSHTAVAAEDEAADSGEVAIEDLSMLELFRVETEQQSALLSDGLLALEQSPDSAETLESLMRAAHSIKGAARLVGISAVVDLAHVMEDGFVAAQEGRLRLAADQIDKMLAGVDAMQQLARTEAGPAQWLDQNRAHYDELLAGLQAMLTAQPEADAAQTTEPPPQAEPPAAPALAVEDMSMLDLFKVETEQQSAVLSEGLLALEQEPANAERLEALMRAAHSIKGAARLVGIQAVVELAHVMEDSFVAAQAGTLVFSAEHIDTLLAGVDAIQGIAAEEAGPAQWLARQQHYYDQLLSNVKAILKGEAAQPLPQAEAGSAAGCGGKTDQTLSSAPDSAPSPAAAQEQAVVTPPAAGEAAVAKASSPSPPSPQKERVLRVSAEQIDRLMGLAGESMVESRWLYPFAGSLQRLKRQQTELVCILDGLRDHLDAELHNSSLIALAHDAQKQASYCRELLADRMAELESFDRRASNLSSRLRQEVVKSRMRPFGDGIHGFPRMVRDVARKLGKSVQLVIEGESTMVDRDILDKIEAPLNHIIRNAIDHGLETEEERLAAGKPPKGTLHLRAYHHAGMLSVVVEDDGRGVDLEKLRAKVVERGLVDESMSETLSDAELMDFLFLPSFSTRDAVSEISGRGVGLDVVHDVMQEMRGSVRATTKLGNGTRFHMQLPLTLSVIPALLVEVGDEPYAFPLARIDRIIRIEKGSVQEAEGSQFVAIEGRNIGLVGAAQILGMSAADTFPEHLSVVVLSDRNHYYGMVVDRFVGERELVVQVMPSRLGKVQDISSAALMEDGSPILIVDVDDLIRSIEKVLKITRLGRVTAMEAEVTAAKRILVVDDSITVREVERKLLQAAGYQVEVAVDGMDGLNALRSGRFDLLITDVDMPRMNGIELTSTVRQDPQLRSLPIMMVSYKDREEDRMRGMQAGADFYLTKGSFHDESLRNVVVDLIGEARQ